jgi:hypothetical protein
LFVIDVPRARQPLSQPELTLNDRDGTRAQPDSSVLASFGHILVDSKDSSFGNTQHAMSGVVTYSGDCDRLFRSNVTAYSGGSALGGFLTPIGHVASTFSPFPDTLRLTVYHGVTRSAVCRDSGRSSWRSTAADFGMGR